ncbi:4-alpha-glucanotransferase [Marinihelvus fidelis]|uniref:4-alpha-glucanotransferase n=2 Tax=Marinihelvus fidelis TaxID=2613842 RepID=A0A5N0T690_9GAMM|nr:4-alpha-glucanotransferase [Marinihelvus fidelis]
MTRGRRVAGVGLHISSLPSAHGIGDIGDAARDVIPELASMGFAVWQVLPCGPTAYGDSPYQPLSAFAGNEMLVGMSPLVRGGLLEQAELDELEDLPVAHVEYGELIPRKRRLLDRAAGRFHDVADRRTRADYQAFLARSAAWLDDYALFRILKTMHDERPWVEWASCYARRDAAALAQLRDDHADALESVRITQYFFDRQWRVMRQRAARAGIALMGDLPIYIALDSADAWARPDLLRLDAEGRPTHVAGVPPDYFSADGQLWGNPLYDWARHAEDGFAWWIERMRHTMAMCDLVRIDHFRGFEAYWSVPGGDDTARNGQWEPGPGQALFDAINGALGEVPIVAEDLGVITPEVDALRQYFGMPGMKVLQFELANPGFDPATLAEDCACYTGTHDNDTTRGWFDGTGADTRSDAEREATRENALRLTEGQPEKICDDVFRLALHSGCRLAVAPMQDLLGLGSDARMNVPGRTGGNWRWRLSPGALTGDRRLAVRAMIRTAGRELPDSLH